MVAEVNPLSVVSDNVLGTRVLVVATGNQLLHSEQTTPHKLSAYLFYLLYLSILNGVTISGNVRF